MSITPAFLDELRARVRMSDLVGRFVSWDQKKSSPGKGDFWAPCPFHNEKTPSFHVDDKKGYYYCFGCHAKGDAIGFLREKSNMDFIEAVRELASMAGMEMPKADREARAQYDKNARLIAMHEEAVSFYVDQLRSDAGANARQYLKEKRALSEAVIAKFEIGLAPNARGLLTAHLQKKGFTKEEMIEGGLAGKSEEGGARAELFDRFRARIVFPIRNARGKVIGFGGRALLESAKAKYLNSPETPIFKKGRELYNLHRARNHVTDDTHLIICEGYMDVIALEAAGFVASIAPLGTAITEDQLSAIWRIDPAPIIALDGDEAGIRAARRLCNLALPLLGPASSLRFAIMPMGQDPDDVIQKSGAKGFGEILGAARPMVDMLWEEALGVEPLDTPEARAALDARLKAMVNMIRDTALRGHYFAEFRARRKALWQDLSPTRDHSQSPAHQDPKARSGFHTGKAGPHPSRSAFASIPNIPNIPGSDLRVALYLRAIFETPGRSAKYRDILTRLNSQNTTLDTLRKEAILAAGNEEAIKRLASEENINKTSIYALAAETFARASSGERIDDILEDDEARVILAMDAEAEINAAMGRMQNGGLGEEDEEDMALLSQAVRMRDEANRLFDNMDEESDEEFGAYLRQFLESESRRE